MERTHSILKPRRASGFTLVEMAIVLGISAILLTVFYAFVAESMADAADESSEIKMQRGIRSPMSELVQELEGAHLFAVDDYANWICYQVPQVGVSGTPVFKADNNNPVVVYGAIPFDKDPADPNNFLVGGYYQIVFVNSTVPGDVLIESQNKNAQNLTGQNFSGTFGMGSTNFAIANDKAYQLGHFEIECHDAPAKNTFTVGDLVPTAAGTKADGVTLLPGTVTSGPGGAGKGPSRVIAGTALRQLDLTDKGIVNPMRTWPWGGFFFMRNPGNLNTTTGFPKHSVFAAGGVRVAKVGTGTWGPQIPDSYTDTNNNGVKDDGEPMSTAQDINGNGFYDGPDCDGFNDLPVDFLTTNQGNNMFDGVESLTNTTTWNGSLLIKMCAFDSTKLISSSQNTRDAFSSVRTISTRIKIRNK